MTLGVLLLVLASTAKPAPATGSSGCLLPPEVGLKGRVVMASGRHLEGKILGLSGAIATVQRDDDWTVEVQVARIRGVIPRTCLERLVPYGALGHTTVPQVRLILSDGETLVGHLAERSDHQIVLETGSGRRELERSDVLAEVALEERFSPILLVDRHLEAPTAILTHPGLLHFWINEGSHLAVSYGIIPGLAVSGGAILPHVVYTDASSSGWELSLRTGLPMGEHLHLAAGLHATGSSATQAAAMLSATVTWSVPACDASVHAGPTPRSLGITVPFPDNLGLALSATCRLDQTFSLLSENWVNYAFNKGSFALAARARRDRLAGDLGVVISSGGSVHPWFGVTVELGAFRP